jgi:hypothetical protein
LSDEGVSRPDEVYERLHAAVPPYMYEVPIPYGVKAEDLEFDTKLPLNVRDVVVSRMRGMDDTALSRFVTVACVLYWNSGEGTSIMECLFKASELEREGRL